MYKITLLITCLLSINFISAQCTQPASNFGNNTVANYDVSGGVNVVLNANNTVTVNLGNNFSTAPGPDVRIFLVNRGNLTDNQLKSPSNFLSSERFEIGLLSSFNGASSYTAAIPSNASLADFQTIFFYCLQFDQFWDFGSFTAIDSSNCTLSSESIESNSFSLYPNPAIDEISIESNTASEITSVSIYDVLGKVVYTAKGTIENKINIQELKIGAYFVKITDSQNFTTTQKFLKKS